MNVVDEKVQQLPLKCNINSNTIVQVPQNDYFPPLYIQPHKSALQYPFFLMNVAAYYLYHLKMVSLGKYFKKYNFCIVFCSFYWASPAVQSATIMQIFK